MPEASSDTRTDARTRIVDVAARLLREQGPAAVTTRGVAEAAGMQAPAIYRLFGDKDGLLEAVAEHVMATYVSAKAATVEAAAADHVDPLDDLRAGWRTQIDFGLANPSVFRLLNDPDRARHSPAAQSGRRVLESRVHRVAVTGRLRVSEQRAVDLIHAAGVGAIQTLLATPPQHRDPDLTDDLYDAVLRHILTDAATDTAPPPGDNRAAATIAFRAIAPQLEHLSDGERLLLTEWLDRTIDTF
jgi:AcrR family transcriptional regulator